MLARDTAGVLPFCSTALNSDQSNCNGTWGDLNTGNAYPAGMAGLAKFMDQNDAFYRPRRPAR